MRETLTVLVHAGLVQRNPVTSPTRGRPAWVYEASVPADVGSVMSEFAEFAQAICHYLRASTDNPIQEARRIGSLWSAEMLRGQEEHGQRHEQEIVAMQGEGALHHGVAKLRLLFSSLGFAAVAGSGPQDINLTVCPFAPEGKAPDSLVCHMHAGMLSTLVQNMTAGHVDACLSVGIPVEPCVVSLKAGAPHPPRRA